MCRIAGVINKNQSLETTVQQVKAMCDIMQHGGPDDHGIYLDSETAVCLGNRRLAILDLSTNGHQPMQSIDENIVITYNGEIYNFKILKATLIEVGFTFKTNTDTEVIIYAYQHWGEAAFEKLDGIFAFSLYDKIKQYLYLVRDPSGVKPLYYHFNKGTITFASEVKAFPLAGINHEDENWRIYYLAFGHIPEPYSTLKNVGSLEKGHFLKYQLKTGIIQSHSFYEYQSSSIIKDEQFAIVKIREELSKAIRQQLIADTPIGVLFSGGLDSSIITVLANQYSNGNLTCISADFDEIDYSENKQRTSLLNAINGNKIERTVTYRDFVQNFSTVLKDMDQPTNDGINTWFICQAAKKKWT